MHTNKPGRRPRSTLNESTDKIRTIVWAHEVIRLSGLGSANAVKKTLSYKGRESVNFYQYKNGSRTPNETKLKLIEKNWAGTRIAFEAGPLGAPLWVALFSTNLTLLEDLADLDLNSDLKFISVNSGTRQEAVWRVSVEIARARLAMLQATETDLLAEPWYTLECWVEKLLDFIPANAVELIAQEAHLWSNAVLHKLDRRFMNKVERKFFPEQLPPSVAQFSDTATLIFRE